MKKDYVREVGLSTLAKSIKINFKLILMVLVPFMIVAVTLIVIKNQRQISKFTTMGVIQVNNINPLTYSDLPSLDPNDSSTYNGSISSSSLSTNSEAIASLLTTDFILNDIIVENHFDIDVQLLKGDGFLDNLKASFGSSGAQVYPNISKFDVSHKYYNHKLKLVFMSPSQYVLYDNFAKISSGIVGQQLVTKDITLLVDSYSGNPKQKFVIIKNSVDAVIANLVKQIKVEPVVIMKKSSQSDTGIINISITDVNPVRQALLINDIIEEVRTKSWERQRQNLKQSIEFIENQTVRAKRAMDMAQESLVAFQSAHNIINLNDQAKNDLITVTDLDLKILDKQITIDQYKSLYTADHPLMIGLRKQRDLLKEKRDEMYADLMTLPSSQATFATLKNDMDVNQQLYLLLLNKEQNLKIKYSGITSPVDVLTYASSDVAPITVPLSAKVMASSLAGILMMEIFFVLWFTVWMTGDPYLLPHLIDSKLLAIVPHLRNKKKGIDYRHPGFNVINAYFLRKLSESRKSNVCCNFGSINQGSGKTFIIDAISNYFTRRDKRVLHISFGSSHEFMSLNEIDQYLDEDLGFSDLCLKKVNLKISIQNSMDIMSFKQLLRRVSNFDFVFIESWAILDSQVFMNMSKLVDENIIVSEPGDTPGLVKLMADGFSNLDISVSRIIYNHPTKPLLNSVYSINKVD